ncbi:PREDICTED: E3 ubiquitin-protein ligase At1g63170 [Ipomoea nil]|uniref:E3 ubiquitin-protein ligase At1g63170 n=1 Tax=Ipomoea nil TaxID=35883 RepID=UPI0009014A6B|nr:PREDICTED: E3 ubiquitin-protein ligase At1g63170 [Ipomoea nil]XP_019179422.1 PREDICTED: E3 ubiquitin-protein ligase At1g63170 [Ipomoea nil]XP_019179423.1 PREDICTED: E3 ubiquitin-protein ligase At1g63170 [Ipomoea nil]XP_019179424.1 PREDICTED: E3 ubiquitin-protein ligase At1g63170 [Ipomoea nil]XP_019179425.1 PREDICTED: E3 ubiquitin-protein ligase At1g63170 [Ipomoea nil]XP_019179426.1 PREDICTED: E3 ubiquitin-protein ligase At1g63170 [Ipomoea nil]XP_019179427.1 PREDICTED: E3 ubiquitin-protein 
MERPENHSNSEHTIDITSSSEASSSGISHDRSVNDFQHQQTEDQPSTSVTIPVYQRAFSSTTGSNTRNSSFVRRGNGRSRHRSPLNSGLWISVELVLTVSQIIAAIVVLSLSRHEHPRTPLFAWIVGYASGCVVILPLLYWRYRYRNQSSEQDSQQQQNSSRGDLSAGPPSSSRTSEGEGRRTTATSSRWGQSGGLPNARLKALVEYFKMALDCFFAVWFVVGNVWIFGGHSSSSEAPNMYRLCIVFLTFSCIGYAMPFILCATICCCLPCIISILGFREDLSQNRGATPESINSLPTYKFKVKKNKSKDNGGAASEGGIVAAGTEKERMISGEDAVCCICLAKYVNNDELRELPCSHFFHKDCVDKWLKINNTCPLCKAEVGETLLGSLTEATANLHASSVF